MRWAAVILCLALAPLFAAPTKKVPAKKPVITPKSKVVAAGSASRSRSRKGRVSRAKPKPSFQSHPDPDRYQQIQQSLADRGYFKGQVNGQWNDDSVDALRRFQMDQKLPGTDGKLDALSLTALGLGPKHGAEASTPASPLPPMPATPSTPDPATAPPTPQEPQPQP